MLYKVAQNTTPCTLPDSYANCPKPKKRFPVADCRLSNPLKLDSLIVFKNHFLMEKQNAGYANTHNQFLKVVNTVESAGDAYQPTSAHLSLSNLKAFHLTIEPMLSTYNSTERLQKTAITNRQTAFDALDNRARRVAVIAAASQMAPHVIEKVTNYKNLIDGTNIAQTAAKLKVKIKKAKKAILAGEDVEMPTKGRSVSQQSINMRLQNYKSMLDELKDAGTYTTNETDMTLVALQQHYTELETVNNAAIALTSALKDKLTERNALIAGNTNSVKSHVDDLRLYFLSKTEGRKGKEYKDIMAVKFFKVKPNK
jgi:predicted phage tail protein